MSVVPNDRLYSADSLELITYKRTIDFNSAQERHDIFTENLGFWKQVIIRNFQVADNITYRLDPNAPVITLPPSSERTIKGWGSFLEVNSAAAAPTGEIEFEIVSLEHAVRRLNRRI